MAIIETWIMHIEKALSTIYGWLIAISLWGASFFAPAYYPFAVVGILIIIDLFWGIAVALKQKKFILSEALRDTCKKIAVYGSCLASVYLIENIFYQGIAITSIAAGLAGTCEVFSFSASMLIIIPDFPFISLFRQQLKGEMEKKLGKQINIF